MSVSVVCVLASGAAVLAGETRWPQEFKVDETRIVLFEPQYETLDQELLKGRAAVAITPQGRSNPIFGAAWIESKVTIDRDARTVRARSTRVTRVHLPDSTAEEEARLQERMARVVSGLELTVSLDRVTAGLDASRNERRTALDLNMTPPRILIETSPAFLVVLDGPPKTIKVQGSDLERVVNTPTFIVRDSDTGRHYLQGGGRWYQADAIAGPWRVVEDPPREVVSMWEKGASREASSSADASDTNPPSGPPPRVIVSTEPAELIVSDGEPQFAAISGLDLLYMSNTYSDVLMDVGSQSYYVLLSGRWFRSKSLEGSWEHVQPDMLPESFAKIPPGSPKGDVLASVAGTPQAEEEILDSAVPQTAVIRKSEAKLTVTYDGEPTFKPIPNTKVAYAVNTNAQVLKIKGRYYAVDQGVWFISESPTGPWAVADDEPPEAQSIPPDSPVYNTKYVYVYETDGDLVYSGYLPGYLGYYPYHGTVVYGTGWYYPGWYGSVYYPYPWTWGFGVHYSSWAGWSFGFGVGFGYGWYPYSPWYAWGYPGWWGPIGWYPCHSYAYYPYYGRYAHATVPPGRAPRGSNTNLYRLPESTARVARTRDKYAARASAASRGRGQSGSASGTAATGRVSTPGRPGRPGSPGQTASAAGRATATGRSVARPDVTRMDPRQTGRPRSAPQPSTSMPRPGSPGTRSTPGARAVPPGRASVPASPPPSARSTPGRRPQAAPPAPSAPPSMRSGPPASRPSSPSFGMGGGRSYGGGRSFGGGHSFNGGRSFGGGRPMGMGSRGFGGGGAPRGGAPHGGGHRGR